MKSTELRKKQEKKPALAQDRVAQDSRRKEKEKTKKDSRISK